MPTPYFVADAPQVTIMRSLASSAYGTYNLALPDGIDLEDIYELDAPGNEVGFVASLQTSRVGGLARRFIRADVSITSIDPSDESVVPESNVDVVLTEVAERVASDFFLESDISIAGLGAWTPLKDFHVGDKANVEIWGHVVTLPITRIEPIISDHSVVDWSVHVGGQLVSDDDARVVENAAIQKALIQDRRELAELGAQVSDVDSKADGAVSTANGAAETASEALAAVNDADGVVRGLVDEGRAAADEARAKAGEARGHAESALGSAEQAVTAADEADRLNEEVKTSKSLVDQAVATGRNYVSVATSQAALSLMSAQEARGQVTLARGYNAEIAANVQIAQQAVTDGKAEVTKAQAEVTKAQQAVTDASAETAKALAQASAASASATAAAASVSEARSLRDEVNTAKAAALQAVTDGRAEVTKAQSEVTKAQQASTAAGSALSAAQSVKVDVTTSAGEVATALSKVVGYHGEVLQAHGEAIDAASAAAGSASTAASKALDASSANTSAISAMQQANSHRDAAITAAADSASKASAAAGSASTAASRATAAAGSATTAAGHASTAASKALDAASANTSAISAMQQANSHRDAAITAASNASTQAGTAANSAALAAGEALEATRVLGVIVGKQAEINTSLSKGVRAAASAAAQASVATMMNSQAIEQVSIATQKALDAAAENASAIASAQTAANEALAASNSAQSSAQQRSSAWEANVAVTNQNSLNIDRLESQLVDLRQKLENVQGNQYDVFTLGPNGALGWFRTSTALGGDVTVSVGGTFTGKIVATVIYPFYEGLTQYGQSQHSYTWDLGVTRSWTIDAPSTASNRDPVYIRFEWRRDAAQVIQNNTTASNRDIEEENTWVTLHSLTIPKAAECIASMRVGWHATTNGDQYGVRIRVGGTATSGGTVVANDGPRSGLGPLTPLGDGYRVQTASNQSFQVPAGAVVRLESYTTGDTATQRRVRDATLNIAWLDVG